MPTFEQVRDILKATNTSSLIDHLRVSLSRALDFFPPFCGRLGTTKNKQNGTTSFFINCNNDGAQLNHATAHGIRVSDIVESDYNPYVVHATFQPCFAVQVTELEDGIFIGCSNNHVVVDGTSFWHFYNSWTEISRGFNVISKIPFLKRHRFIPPPMLRERVFHFTKESVAKLKAKANLEMNTTKISSLQAVLAHVWRSVSIDMRERLNPPLPEGFFGNAICPATVTIKTGELLEHEFGWAALQINETIALHDQEKLKCIYESWMNDPEVVKLGDLPSNYFMLNNSPRFDFYKYDFGWGKPITHRSGIGNMLEGKITVSPGQEEGSMILEICLSSETIQALEEDVIFGEFVTTPAVGLEPTIRARI
ncbi:hypothetical protein R3W88_003612 [Solanum pinnatisectum]|uniref:HXXXD-type acyl-transferase family protein n=1 Tax=Solanum pinnatisectum TaxID=50273 RepID=A0AAV9MPJ6_9SOLN|nr:hypothetical protein R3W88_003612 [Solanum pinnatisectum]